MFHTIIKKFLLLSKKQIKHGKFRTEKKFGDGKSAQKIVKILNTVDLSIEKVLEKHFNYE